MSKFFNTTASNLIAASLALGLLSPAAMANNMMGSNIARLGQSQAALAYQMCPAPKSFVRVCTDFGPADPGKLFGRCLHYETKCESPAYLGK